ncbi:hypothetical protein TNCV_4340611 [Trichonephila clavipes]|nr:hypothetical protein TNCV_4340611 [Trichonephila clavipes]
MLNHPFFGEALPEQDLTFDDCVLVDTDIAVWGALSDAEIVALDHNNTESDDGDSEELTPLTLSTWWTKPSNSDASLRDAGRNDGPPRVTTVRDDRWIVRRVVMDRIATSRTIAKQIHSQHSTPLQESGMSARRPLTGNHRRLRHHGTAKMDKRMEQY